MNYWEKRYIVISGLSVLDGGSWLEFAIFFINSFDGVGPSLSKWTCVSSVDQDIFSFGTIGFYWCVCSYLLFLLGTTVADRKCLMKVICKSKVRFYEKLFTCVFLLTWPRPPKLEGTLLQAFPFWISFFWVLLFLFHFQPSYISSKFKRPFFFLLWFWLQRFLFFPASQPKFRDSDAKDNDSIPFDIESSGVAGPNNWHFI